MVMSAPWRVSGGVRIRVGVRRTARWPWDQFAVVKVLTLPGPLLTPPRREREESASLLSGEDEKSASYLVFPDMAGGRQ